MSDTPQNVSCRCMCGAVTFKAKLKNAEVGVCHCSMCRRWTGGAFLGISYEGELNFDNQNNVGVYKSSDWGERGFCKSCGSSLFWRMQDGSMGVLSAQSVVDLKGAHLDHEIFIDEKPDYYNFAEATKKMTGAEVMAMFAPKA